MAADIAGNDGWMPLSAAVERYDLPATFASIVLDGGGEITCVGTNADGKRGITNRFVGWFLYGRYDAVFGPGHVLFSKDVRRDELPGCYIATNRAVMESDEYETYPLEPSPTAHYVGGVNPAGVDQVHDKVVLKLAGDHAADLKRAGVVPLVPDGELASSIRRGKTVYLVSAARPFVRNLKGYLEPQVQQCRILGIEESEPERPGRLLLMNCDAMKGVSGSLVFADRPAAPRQYVPIAMQIRAIETMQDDGKPMDGLPADTSSNVSVALAMDADWNNFPVRGDQVLERRVAD